MYINPENQSPVFVIHNSTPDEDRQRIIEKYKSKTIAGTHQSGSEGKNKQTTDTKRRDSGVHFVADDIDLTMHVFNLIRIAFIDFSLIALCNRFGLVTVKSSPTSWIFVPRSELSFCHPLQSFSSNPSSMEIMGYFLHKVI